MAHAIHVCTRKGLFRFVREERGWRLDRHDFPGVLVTAILPDGRDGSVYAAVKHEVGGVGILRRRPREGGWVKIACPRYPAEPSGWRSGSGAMDVPWTLQMIWSLEGGGDDRPGLLWAGTIPGALFRSADFGASWSIVESLWYRPERLEWIGRGYEHPGIHSICVDPRDSSRLAVAVSRGGIWESGDLGESWAVSTRGMWAGDMPASRREDPLIQDPHRMVQCPANPNVFWVQHHDGVFRSVDGGASWDEITGLPLSSFGFTVAVSPLDPKTAWLIPVESEECRIPVGARLRVLRTRDAGRTFDVLSRGLPEDHAYDIVHRHALDVDSSGLGLIFGSTTGSLWYSADGGESWERISAHLPPIHACRFAVGPAS